jgi:hypothetical protein
LVGINIKKILSIRMGDGMRVEGGIGEGSKHMEERKVREER